ncbi:GTP cyclohydrolase 1 [Clostridia bacterium]|nr:GTP cyclohydrolase 1 [Clostridia bacterium]
MVISAINKEKIENAVKEILEALGEDVTRKGLQETPKRVAAMCQELFAGYGADPKQHVKLLDEFGVAGEIIVVKDIPVRSVCEHHLLPFFGVAHIAYIPRGDKIIGLSKLSRIVDHYAKRLQVQERLTLEIADFICDNLDASGVAVVMETEHLCVTMRGTKAAGSKTKTAIFKGNMQTNPDLRNEAVSLLMDQKNKKGNN